MFDALVLEFDTPAHASDGYGRLVQSFRDPYHANADWSTPTAVSVAALGDQSQAFQTTAITEGIPVTVDGAMLFVRKASLVYIYFGVSVPSTPLPLVREIAGKTMK